MFQGLVSFLPKSKNDLSAQSKLPSMEFLAETRIFLQKDALSCKELWPSSFGKETLYVAVGLCGFVCPAYPPPQPRKHPAASSPALHDPKHLTRQGKLEGGPSEGHHPSGVSSRTLSDRGFCQSLRGSGGGGGLVPWDSPRLFPVVSLAMLV